MKTKNKKSEGFKDYLIRYLLLTLSAAIFAFNLKSFIRTGNLIPGGFSGIAVLVQQIGERFFNVTIPFSAVYLPLNIIPAIIGFKFIGKWFTIESFYVVALSSILTDIMPNITITYDVLLVAIFGGIVGTIAMVICLRAGASSGGTDFISIYFSEKKGVDTWGAIFAGNVVVLGIAGVLFGFDRALYSIIYQYTLTVALGQMYKRYQQDTLLIVTSKPKEIVEMLDRETDHTATELTGIGSYSGEEKSILYSVIGRDQVSHVIKEINEIDEQAFTNVIKTEQVNGSFARPERR